MALLQDLTDLTSSLQVLVDGALTVDAAQALTARIVPPSSTLNVGDVSPLNVDLQLIGKGILFSDANPNNAGNSGPLSAFDLTAVPPTKLVGVPGLLGTLKGTLQVPVQVHPILTVNWSLLGPGGAVLVAGTDFFAPNGVNSPEITLTIVPPTADLTLTAPAVQTYTLRATVILSVGAVASPARNIDVPITVLPILIPTVLAMFEHANFGGAVLVMVDNNSPIGSTGELVNNVLQPLQQKIGQLTSLAQFAAFLVGLQSLTQALNSPPHIVFRKAHGVTNLNDIDLYGGFWNDTEAEDELSSILFIGPSGRRGYFYNDRDYNHGEGWFSLVIGPEMWVEVRTLNAKHPASGPVGNEIDVRHDPDGGSFNDALSSVHFDP